jgi:hypothetical protein
LICAFGRCHAECGASRDCPRESRCVHSENGEAFVCQFDEERDCKPAGECQGAQVCAVDAECRDECESDADCAAQQSCLADLGVCADDEELDSEGQLPVIIVPPNAAGDDEQPESVDSGLSDAGPDSEAREADGGLDASTPAGPNPDAGDSGAGDSGARSDASVGGRDSGDASASVEDAGAPAISGQTPALALSDIPACPDETTPDSPYWEEASWGVYPVEGGTCEFALCDTAPAELSTPQSNTSVRFGPFDLSAASNPVLYFQATVSLRDGANGITVGGTALYHDGELFVEVSNDTIEWSTAERLTPANNTPTFNEFAVSLADHAGEERVWLRWRLRTEPTSSGDAYGVCLSSVQLVPAP